MNKLTGIALCIAAVYYMFADRVDTGYLAFIAAILLFIEDKLTPKVE